MAELRTEDESAKEVARDQAWIYLRMAGRRFFLEIHHDGGPWGADKQVRIPLTRKQANEVEVAFRGRT